MKKILSLLILYCGISSLLSQEYKSPESAVYDPVGKRYFISNFGDGSIIELDSIRIKHYFKTGLSNSLGMIIHDKTLFVVSNKKNISGFDLNNGEEVFYITIKEATFLNDITCDDQNNLYVTGSNTKSIYKINPQNNSYIIYWDTDIPGPNGILFNPFSNSLVICNFTENALIQSISLTDSSIVTLDSTDLDNLDGLAIDNEGNIYVSSWAKGSFTQGYTRNGAIHKYDNAFNLPPALVVDSLLGPADIYYNVYEKKLIVPLLLDDKVEFFSVNRQ